jgi:hypothetical protein
MPTPTDSPKALSYRRMQNIVRRLNGSDRLLCREAAEELAALPDEGIRQIVDYNKGLLDPGEEILNLILVFVLASFLILIRSMLPLLSNLLLGGGLLCGGVALVRILAAAKRINRRCRGVSRVIEPTVGHLDSVTAIPVIVDTLFNQGECAHELARAILIRLLPRLGPGQQYLLVPSQQLRLNDVLRGNDSDLIVAILQAYAQVGDASTLEPVAQLARSAADVRVREAANRCLPPLRARIEAEQEQSRQTQMGKMLLRGSQPAEASPETLLRAATATPQETAPEQLLRSSVSEVTQVDTQPDMACRPTHETQPEQVLQSQSGS